MTAPMTAAEYRRSTGFLTERGNRILAALEEREALLGERDRLERERDSVQERLDNFLTFSADCDDLAFDIAGELGIADKMQGTGREWVNYLHANRHLLREAVAALKSDASVGALVRRIREHPAATRGHSAFVYTHNGTWTTAWTEKGLQLTLSHLDSLLPKEPEVAPSGFVYERYGEESVTARANGERAFDAGRCAPWIPPIDREFVAKLLEARNV